jgi:hypothetical protein
VVSLLLLRPLLRLQPLPLTKLPLRLPLFLLVLQPA